MFQLRGMKFKSNLNDLVRSNVGVCDEKLSDPLRLKAVYDSGLLDTPREIAFDRLAKMAALVLKAPITIISIIGEKRQFFKANYGLATPFDVVREVAIDDSICRYNLAGEEIIAADTQKHPLLKDHHTTVAWGIGAFLSIPMVSDEGHVIGSFCAIDPKVHNWSEADLYLMRELTSAVMTEIQLRNQVQEMTADRVMREQFVAALSHDLRNPIGVAKMSADELLSSDDTTPEDKKILTTMIQQNMERADSMIADLLNVTTLKLGDKMQIRITECDFEKLARSTVETLEKMNRREIALTVNGKPKGFWDPQAMRRILENLIGNGIKYGAPAKKINVDVTTENANLLIKVHNEGNPISADMIEKIFEPFRRSDSAVKSKEKGWGIGLPLVRGLVQAHNGEISVQSNADHGTTFQVIIPLDSRSAT